MARSHKAGLPPVPLIELGPNACHWPVAGSGVDAGLMLRAVTPQKTGESGRDVKRAPKALSLLHQEQALPLTIN